MSIKWKYISKLTDEKVFENIEEKYNLQIPEEIIKLIKTANGGSPDKERILSGKTERVFGGLLSYNEGEPANV